jgi:hypothetical protein
MAGTREHGGISAEQMSLDTWEKIERVREQVTLAHDQFDDETSTEYLLGDSLPELYVAIHGLYRTLGEAELLEQRLARGENA